MTIVPYKDPVSRKNREINPLYLIKPRFPKIEKKTLKMLEKCKKIGNRRQVVFVDEFGRPSNSFESNSKRETPTLSGPSINSSEARGLKRQSDSTKESPINKYHERSERL